MNRDIAQRSFEQQLKNSSSCLRALGHPARLQIFRFLVRGGEQGKCVGEIQRALSMPASTLSHHLSALEKVGLIMRKIKGTTHYCIPCFQNMENMLDFLFSECCADQYKKTSQHSYLHKLIKPQS